jgi:hypothetical protein
MIKLDRIQILNPLDPDPTVEFYDYKETVVEDETFRTNLKRNFAKVSEFQPADQAVLVAALRLYATAKAIHDAHFLTRQQGQ